MTIESTVNKIVDPEKFDLQVKNWQQKGMKVVFSNGCFDILHPGHVDYLERARKLGDKLVIGLNSDTSVRRIKGDGRPIVAEEGRAKVLAGLQFVDLITLFEEDTPLRLIENTIPDILVKGSDYSVDQIVGADIVINKGGKVETLPLVEGYSTTLIMNKIVKNKK